MLLNIFCMDIFFLYIVPFIFFLVYTVYFIYLYSKAKKYTPKAKPSFLTLIFAFLFSFSMNVHFKTSIEFNSRARHFEIRQNFLKLFDLQKIYFSENGKYMKTSETITVKYLLGDENERWKYSISCGEPLEIDYMGEKQLIDFKNNWPFDIVPEVTKTSYKCVGIGNIDRDDMLDVWVFTHEKNLFHLVDDVITPGQGNIFMQDAKELEWKIKFISEYRSSMFLLSLICFPGFISCFISDLHRSKTEIEKQWLRRTTYN